jgi:curved DNA-binding protein CbpA
MSGSTACPYKILGVSHLAEDDEIELAFEVYKQAYELLIDGKKRGAHDRKAANEEKKVKNYLRIYVFHANFFRCSSSRLNSLKRS